MLSDCYRVFIYTALPCEAKPLVEHFKLKKETAVKPFDIYVHRHICLTVTGLGKSAMAAGVAYSQALYPSVENPVMINIGIAGHQNHVVGSLFLIDKITDSDSCRSWYPPLVFSSPCPTGSIKTASRPQLDYNHPDLCDMEASAFYETATRFASSELVQCLKVVSDNRLTPVDRIKPQNVSGLIAAHIRAIEDVSAELLHLADLATFPEPRLVAELTSRYRFTVNERVQLGKQLRRWDSLTGGRALDFDRSGLRRGGDLLRWLGQQIDALEFHL
jgi:adenosylhomocysteine nucleosidase